MADLGEGEGQEAKEPRGFWKECLNSEVQARTSGLAEAFCDNTALISRVGVEVVHTVSLLLLGGVGGGAGGSRRSTQPAKTG